MINDTTPAVLSPSPQHRPNDRSSISIRCRARQTKRKRCSRGHRSKRDHDAFPDFAQWASRSEFEPVSSITHPSLLFSPPTDYCSDRSDRPTGQGTSNEVHVHVQVRDATKESITRRIGTKVRSEGFRFCNRIYLFLIVALPP